MMLQDIYVHTDGDYPFINGVAVSKDDDGRAITQDGHYVYHNLNIPIFYTGDLYIGSYFVPECYIHMGYQMDIAYKKVLKLSCMEGRVMNVEDLSKKVARKRKRFLFNNKHPKLQMLNFRLGFGIVYMILQIRLYVKSIKKKLNLSGK